MNKIFSIKVNNSFSNITIRELLLKFHLGKEKIYAFENAKAFFVNEENVNQFYQLKENDDLDICLEENIDLIPFPSTIQVVYEDDNFLFVNKPRGVLVHEDGNNNTITLANMVACYYKNHHIRRKIRICNRIDVETEGIVMFAKNPVAESYLNNLIFERKVDKRYYVVCYNRFSSKKGTINLPIGRNLHESNKMIVYKKGKEAITEYSVLKNGHISLVEAKLITGRTHQIRVHFTYLNHPLVGDMLYNNDGNQTMGLQAFFVSFYNIFENKKIEVKLPLSSDLKELLDYGN